ncbi:S4 domain-containing protein [Aureispira sp. CCB-E]|uniref:RNA-binding S4 domain-containing protein n=1 Tax=Aureispira sp. CCB-E TaxID=3051121 RepID=UPI00286889F6|nr:S4 domain-containing protein [Aureispira sp. CCB-E]WMX12282.1 RNA-binding S4 domain-containing protein [Aureispira sp. CCB-E]
MTSKLEKVRVDKWLWAVRIFKSRTLATNACKSNKVMIDGVALKPSSSIERGMTLQVKKEGYNMTYKVVDLLEKRVSATLAEPCYENLTPEEELNKFKDWYLFHKGSAEVRQKGAGRPTKRERREMDKFKNK